MNIMFVLFAMPLLCGVIRLCLIVRDRRNVAVRRVAERLKGFYFATE
jgi:hypothetical protein